ncbi:MAG: dihydrofolate reductase family protein, partial [Ignavibacteriaceae bacterium]
VLVEGGKSIFSSFVKENLYDDLFVFISPKILGNGIPAVSDLGIKSISKSLKVKFVNAEMIGDDVLAELTK